jgi:hypothetical protein
VKYTTLVAYDAENDAWYVVPACDVVALIAGKERGQHTENPFESSTLSLRNLGHFKVASANLSAACDAAVVKSDGKPLLKQKMKDVLQEYFKELEDESLRDNFVITYELLDEMMDHGYP